MAERSPSARLLLDHVAALAGDLRAWVSWAEATGAVDLPHDPAAAAAVAPLAPPRQPRPSAPRSPAAPARPAMVSRAGQVHREASAERDAMQGIREELGECQRCKLAQGRHHLVFGVGDPAASLLLVGEAPGKQEDETGEPFVGRSGRLLTRMLGALGLQRSDVYICNIIKCRPPDNRDPEPDEVAACSPFVHRQIQTVAPKVILALGRFAARTIIDVDAPLSRLRGRDASYHHIPVVATYHPSYLLRTPVMKREAWRDLLRVRRLLAAPL